MSQDSVMGIDVSSEFLDLHVLPQAQAARHTNDAEGIREVLQVAKDFDVGLIVMESTGGLERPLALECGIHQIPTAVMNPRQIRDFARSIGKLAKTDAIEPTASPASPSPSDPRPVPSRTLRPPT